MSENQITMNFIYLASSNFMTISPMNYWDQVNSWKSFWKFWNGPLSRNKSGPSPYSKLQHTGGVVCAKKPSQILSNSIGNGGSRIGCRIYVRYCRQRWDANQSNISFNIFKPYWMRCWMKYEMLFYACALLSNISYPTFMEY